MRGCSMLRKFAPWLLLLASAAATAHGQGQSAPVLSIISGPTANPNPAMPNQTVQFFVSASLPGLTYVWDFGDGITSNGSLTTHNFLVSGSYNVQVTVTQISTGSSIVASLTVDVGGYRNIPAGSIVSVSLLKPSFSLRFRTLSADRLNLTIVSAANFAYPDRASFFADVRPRTYTILIGNQIVDTISVFRQRGKGQKGKLFWNIRSGTVHYKGINLDLIRSLAPFGVQNETSSKQISVPIFLEAGDVRFGGPVSFQYSGVLNRSGSGR